MTMYRKSSCVFGCDDFGAYMHRFPHPYIRSELHSAWVSKAGTKLTEVDPLKVYGNKRICDYHFTPEEKTSGHQLTCSAVPTLNLEGMFKSFGASVDMEHNYCIPRMKNISLEAQHLLKIIFERVPIFTDPTDQPTYQTRPDQVQRKNLKLKRHCCLCHCHCLKSKAFKKNFKKVLKKEILRRVFRL